MGASAGTLVAAALESAGYKGQSLVLNQLSPLLDHGAMLAFVAAAVIGFSAYALFNEDDSFNPRLFLWCLVGPILFYLTTRITVQSAGAEWQFGDFRGKQQIVDRTIGPTVNANVSWLFDKYNRLISSIVQNAISVLSNDSIRQQLIFMNRERIMDQVFNSEISNPGLLALIHTGLRGECATFMESARRLAAGNRDPQYRSTPEYRDAEANYKLLFQKPSISLGSEDVLRRYLVHLLESMKASGRPGEFIQTYCDPSGNDSRLTEPFYRPVEEVLSEPVTCQEIWCWTAMGIHSEVGAFTAEADEKVRQTPVAESAGRQKTDAVLEEIWTNIRAKMTPPPDEAAGEIAPPAPSSVIPVIVGGMLLKKQMEKDPRSIMASRFAEHAGVYTAPVQFSTEMSRGEISVTGRRMNQAQQVAALQYETYTFAMTIPHIQGFLLYSLSLLFPFFAIFLVIPGQAGHFFSWFALWAWVKSWDVGWVLVMIVDELLWQLMPHTVWVDPVRDAKHSPITVMEAAFQGDPTYSLATYYMVLSVMLTAVPMITAHIVLGSKKAVAGVLLGGATGLGEKLGGSAADGVAAKQIAALDFIGYEAGVTRAQEQMSSMRAATRETGSLYQRLTRSPRDGAAVAQATASIASALTPRIGAERAQALADVIGKMKPIQVAGLLYETNQLTTRGGTVSGQSRMNTASTLSALTAGLSNGSEFWNLWDDSEDPSRGRRLGQIGSGEQLSAADWERYAAVSESIRLAYSNNP